MLLSISIKLIFGLIGIVIITRLLGKKEMSQVTPFDFVYALILGGIIEESLYDEKTSIWFVLYALLLWGSLIYIVEILTQKFEKLRTPLKGRTSFIISNGEVNIKEMKKAKLEMEQIRTFLRMKGIFSLREVNAAVLETSGQLSVLKKSDETTVTKKDLNIHTESNDRSHLLIDEGNIRDKNLDEIQKDKEWLKSEMKQLGYAIDDIFYAEWQKGKDFYIQPYKKESE